MIHRGTMEILLPLIYYVHKCWIILYHYIFHIELGITLWLAECGFTVLLSILMKSENACKIVPMYQKQKPNLSQMNLTDWLSALLLPYNCADLHLTILCAKQISSIQQYHFAYTNENNHNKKKKLRKNYRIHNGFQKN